MEEQDQRGPDLVTQGRGRRGGRSTGLRLLEMMGRDSVIINWMSELR